MACRARSCHSCFHWPTTMVPDEIVTIGPSTVGQTVAALLRQLLPGQSWKQARSIVAARRVFIGEQLCLDPARRLKEGELFALRAVPAPVPRQREQLVIRHLDEHLVV